VGQDRGGRGRGVLPRAGRRRCSRAGVDLFILETFRDLNEIGAAIAAVRSVCDLPIVAQMTTEEDGNSLDGTPPEQFAPALEAPAPTWSASTAASARRRCSRPSSGWPMRHGRAAGRAAQRRQAPRHRGAQHLPVVARVHGVLRPPLHAHGVRLVGGCCGTTPEHIRQISSRSGHAAGRGTRDRPSAPVGGQPAARPRRRSRVARSRLAARSLAAGRSSPRGRTARRGATPGGGGGREAPLKIHGVDVVNIPDGPRSGARMSATVLAVLVEQQGRHRDLLQYACRDRNLLGMQSDLLGAHAMGLRNLLGITGDARSLGDYPDATAVFDVDSIGLTNVVAG
jgi:methionine synthase / methylenetetrahydrofolate reductase(NADPH)